MAIVSEAAEVSENSASASCCAHGGADVGDRALAQELLGTGDQGDPAEHVLRLRVGHDRTFSRRPDTARDGPQRVSEPSTSVRQAPPTQMSPASSVRTATRPSRPIAVP